MGLSRMDVSAINHTFKCFEKDEGGKALVPSILAHYKIKKNRFMERTFTLLHVGREEDVATVTFKQFIYLLWNFCTLGDKMGTFFVGVQCTMFCSRHDMCSACVSSTLCLQRVR